MYIKEIPDEDLFDFLKVIPEREPLTYDELKDLWENLIGYEIYGFIDELKKKNIIKVYAQKYKVGKKGKEIIDKSIEREKEIFQDEMNDFLLELTKISKKVIKELNKNSNLVKFEIREETDTPDFVPYLDVKGERYLNVEYYGRRGAVVSYDYMRIMNDIEKIFSGYGYKTKMLTNNVGNIYYYDWNWIANEVNKIIKNKKKEGLI